MGGAGFEPAKALPPDLQSGPFSHLGIHPVSDDPSRCRSRFLSRDPSAEGRGPNRRIRAGGESRTHNRRFTKPVLCRLSYASHREAVKIPIIPTEDAFASDFSVAIRISPVRRPGPTKATAATGEGPVGRGR